MGFGSFLKKAVPAAAGVLGSPVAGALAGGVLGAFGSGREARGIERAGAGAGQTALGAFNFLSGSPIGQQFLPAGGRAIEQQAALLGLGGDQAAADRAFQNFLDSTGFQGQLRAGQQAVTTSAAARGLLGSGSTAKALQDRGQQLGSAAFNNFFNQLASISGQGLQAGGQLGQLAGQGFGQASNAQFGADVSAAGARSRGFDQLVGGLGSAFDAFQASRRARERREELRNRLGRVEDI